MENSFSNDPYKSDQNISFSHKRFLAPIKLFECKYCARKFLNSKALGGHQNAHKKEKTMWMMGLYDHNKPLRIEPYHKPIQGVVDQDLTSSPESFHVQSVDPNEGSSNGEALNLELVLGSQKPDQSKLEACELDLDLRL